MPAKMTVRAVSFDGDDTLWDFDIVLRHALDVVLEELRRRHPGPATAALTVDKMISIRDQVARDHTGDWSRLEDIRRAAFAAMLEHVGSPDDTSADDLNQLYLRHRFTDTDLFPDVLPCLSVFIKTIPSASSPTATAIRPIVAWRHTSRSRSSRPTTARRSPTLGTSSRLRVWWAVIPARSCTSAMAHPTCTAPDAPAAGLSWFTVAAHAPRMPTTPMRPSRTYKLCRRFSKPGPEATNIARADAREAACGNGCGLNGWSSCACRGRRSPRRCGLGRRSACDHREDATPTVGFDTEAPWTPTHMRRPWPAAFHP